MAQQKRTLLPGTVDLVILQTLTQDPMHGFEVSRSIQARSDGALELQDAALYQALHRMEKAGWVESEWGISDKGLHLGDITIPIPFGALFGYSMSPNAQKTRQMIREFNEIRQQDIETDIRKERDEALKEMRRRTREEVERREDDTTEAAPPDTADG